jgi:hypothetical protein
MQNCLPETTVISCHQLISLFHFLVNLSKNRSVYYRVLHLVQRSSVMDSPNRKGIRGLSSLGLRFLRFYEWSNREIGKKTLRTKEDWMTCSRKGIRQRRARKVPIATKLYSSLKHTQFARLLQDVSWGLLRGFPSTRRQVKVLYQQQSEEYFEKGAQHIWSNVLLTLFRIKIEATIAIFVWFNPLKPTGHVMHHQFNIQQL